MSRETLSGRRLLYTEATITEVVQCFPDLQEICIEEVPVGMNEPVESLAISNLDPQYLFIPST